MGKKSRATGAQVRKTKNVAVEVEVQQQFADYCERRGQVQSTVASRLFSWLLAQNKPVRDWITEPDEVGNSEARAAYCDMLKRMASEVCSEVGNSRHQNRGNMVVG